MACQYVPVMVAAILLAVAVMLLAARPLGHFIDNNPKIKMLALAFIVLIGAYLLVDGLGLHMPKRYTYAAIRFSAAADCLNLWAKRRARQRGEPTIRMVSPSPSPGMRSARGRPRQ